MIIIIQVRRLDVAFNLDGAAVKKDSEGGVHPGEVFGFVILACTLCCGLRKRPTGAGIVCLARQRGLGVRLRTAAARIGSGASPPFFEKKVFPL